MNPVSISSPPEEVKPPNGGRFRVFLSYGDDATELKNRVKKLTEQAFAQVLADEDSEVLLLVTEWRAMAARRAPVGGKTNDIFVGKTRKSSAFILMLKDKLPPGSVEELEAALEDPNRHIMVLWLNPDGRKDSETAKFLAARKDDLSYQLLSDLDSEETWIQITRNLVYMLLVALGVIQDPPFYESRNRLRN